VTFADSIPLKVLWNPGVRDADCFLRKIIIKHLGKEYHPDDNKLFLNFLAFAEKKGIVEFVEAYTSPQTVTPVVITEIAETTDEAAPRTTVELDRSIAYAISNNFTFTKPCGFVLDGKVVTGITTWRELYTVFCQLLYQRDQEKLHSLRHSDAFVSNRGHRAFAECRENLREPAYIAPGLYAEVNRSANEICTMVRKLLFTFDIPEDAMQVFLYENRDSGNAECEQ
jgi:hypothetical protein